MVAVYGSHRGGQTGEVTRPLAAMQAVESGHQPDERENSPGIRPKRSAQRSGSVRTEALRSQVKP